MKLGDKKQVVVLAVVAVLAVVFLVTQLLPKGRRFVASTSPEAAKQEAVVDVVSLPLEVSGNPFSHVKLAPDKKESEGSGETGEIEPLAPNLQGLSIGSPEYQATMWEWERHSKPDENAGETRQEEETDPFNLKFTGYIGGATPMALIEVRGKTGVPFEEGEEIEPGVHVLSIRERSIEVRVGKKVVSLALGQELRK